MDIVRLAHKNRVGGAQDGWCSPLTTDSAKDCKVGVEIEATGDSSTGTLCGCSRDGSLHEESE